MELVEITEGEPFARWHATMKAASARTPSRQRGTSSWRRQAAETVWLLATDGGEGRRRGHRADPAGTPRPTSPELTSACLRPIAGVESASSSIRRSRPGAQDRDVTELQGEVWEDEPDSLAWATRQGFREIGRNARPRARPDADRSAGSGSAARHRDRHVRAGTPPGCRARAVRRRARGAPGHPGRGRTPASGPSRNGSPRDMQGAGDQGEATFVAFDGDQVVGYAKLSLSLSARTSPCTT